MDTKSLAGAVLEPLAVPADRLYPVSTDLYHKMIESGLLTGRDDLGLRDGLIVTAPREGDPDDPQGHLYRFPLDVYEGMVELGILTEHHKLMLLDGLLVTTMPRGPRHATSTRRVVKALERLPLGGWHVRKEDPIRIPGGPGARDSEPEPDAAVVRGGDDLYSTRHPGPGDVALLAEVSDSTLREDRAGLPFYARAGFPVVWLVNLKDMVVEVYTRPTGPADPPRYEGVNIYRKGDHVPVVIDGAEVGRVAVAELLP